MFEEVSILAGHNDKWKVQNLWRDSDLNLYPITATYFADLIEYITSSDYLLFQ